MHQSERPKVSNMDFLKSLVPAVISGEGSTEHGGTESREPGPRLLRVKRLGLLTMGQTIEEDLVDPVTKVDAGMGSSRHARSSQTRLKGTTDPNAHNSVFMLLYMCFLEFTILANLY